MEVLPPNTMRLVVQASSAATPIAREGRPQDLQLRQMIRATVEESAQGKAMLQFGDRRLWVETGTVLKVGDTLNLQVVETQPSVSFKIIEPSVLQRLGQSLHLLGEQSSPKELLSTMLAGSEPGSKQLPPDVREALGRLFTLLQKSPEQLSSRDLAVLPRQLGLNQIADLLAGQTQAARATFSNALGQLGETQRQLGINLAGRLEPLRAAIAQLPELLQSPAATSGKPEDLAAVLRPLLLLAGANPGPETTGLPLALSRPQVAAAAQDFVHALRQYLLPFAELTTEALDRIEQQAALLPQVMQGSFEQTLTSIGQTPQGKDLLSVLLLLFRGSPEKLAGADGRQASQWLIEALQKEIEQSLDRIGNRREEAQQQLELWQLCRARLGDVDTSFLPLPLAFLDSGFLVAHRQSSSESESGAPEKIVSLSLFLDLPKLGPLEIDLLYQNEKLFVRFNCRDQAVADALATARTEIGENLGGLPLSGFAVGVGAESPDRALIRKLVPPEKGIFDAHV